VSAPTSTPAVPDTFDRAVAALRAARTPEQVFGPDPGAAAAVYRAFAKLVHPDRVPPERAGAAHAAFAWLTALWAALLATPVRLGRDQTADYLASVHDGEPVLLKVARRPTDNDLLRREAEALRLLATSVHKRHRAYLPRLRDSYVHRDADTGVERAVNVFDRPEGFVSLASVRDAFPDGLDARDVAWMWRRLLVAIGLAHRAGVVHGAVVPDHVLIHPEQHGLVLVGWCYATSGPSDRVPAMLGRYRDWYPPEVPARERPTAATDIYLATRCVVALMGDRAPQALRAFARGCLLRPQLARPRDAWRLLGELDDVLEKVFGPRRFRPFALPAGTPAWPYN
jgi:hypothetical protein